MGSMTTDIMSSSVAPCLRIAMLWALTTTTVFLPCSLCDYSPVSLSGVHRGGEATFGVWWEVDGATYISYKFKLMKKTASRQLDANRCRYVSNNYSSNMKKIASRQLAVGCVCILPCHDGVQWNGRGLRGRGLKRRVGYKLTTSPLAPCRQPCQV